MAAPAHQQPHDCPRCGYDFSGVIASWQDSCPIHGTCTECGLAFHHGDVLNPAKRIPAWSFEHAAQRRPRAFISTTLRTIHPPKFWAAIRMQFPFRPGRLVLLCLAVILTLYIGFIVEFIAWELVISGLPTSRTFTSQGRGRLIELLLREDTLFFIFWPRTILGEISLSELTTGMYSARDLPLVTWWLLLAATLMPLLFILLPQTLRRAKVRPRHLVRIWLYGLPVHFVLVALPFTIRDTIGSIQDLQWRTTLASNLDVYWLIYGWDHHRWRILTALVGLWQLCWWAAACSRYLKLPRPWAIAAALLAISLLLAAAPLLFSPALGIRWLEQLDFTGRTR